MPRRNHVTAVLQHGKSGKSGKRPRSWHRSSAVGYAFARATGLPRAKGGRR